MTNTETMTETAYDRMTAMLGAPGYLWPDAEAVKALFPDRPGLTAALQRGLTHPWPQVRKHCAILMDHLADQSCVPALRVAIHDPNEAVRRHVLHALTCDPCKECPLDVDSAALVLDVALNDPSLRVRRTAVSYLSGYRDDPRVPDALCQLQARETDSKLLRRVARLLDGEDVRTPSA